MMLSPHLRTASCVAQRPCSPICSKMLHRGVPWAAAVAESIGPVSSAAVPVPEDLTSYPSVLEQVDFDKARQGVAILEQYSSQAVSAVGAAVGGVLSPFQLFGDSWFLSFMFFGTLGLLTYLLLVLAPRQ